MSTDCWLENVKRPFGRHQGPWQDNLEMELKFKGLEFGF
jgi:hypothetical protein